MTKEEIFAKLQTEVTIRGLSPGTYYTYIVKTEGNDFRLYTNESKKAIASGETRGDRGRFETTEEEG